jgi:hypothetical protein
MTETDSVEHDASQAGEVQETADQTSRARSETGSLVPKATVKKAIERLTKALNAKKTVFDRGSSKFVEHEDWPTIVKAAEMLLAYGEGRPVERQVIIKADAQNYDQKLEKLMASPAGRALAKQMGLVTEKDVLKSANPKEAAE